MDGMLYDRVLKIPGRPETGQWLHVTAADPVTGAVELIELMEHGGRLNPPRSFPVAYFSQDNDLGRRGLTRWLRDEEDPIYRHTILVAEMRLPRVLEDRKSVV